MTKRARGLSLRVSITVSLLAVIFMPLLVLLLFSWAGQAADERIRKEVEATTREALHSGVGRATEGIARRSRMRVRWFASDGTLIEEADHNPASENSLGLGSVGYSEIDRRDSGTALEASTRELASQQGFVQWCESQQDGSEMLCSAAARTQAGEFVVVDRASVRGLQRLVELRSPLWVFSALAVGLGLLLSFLLIGHLVVPLRRLRREVLSRSLRVPDTRPIDLRAPPEIDDVKNAFNSLLQSLERQRNSNQRFVEDLAHELKTPLASIQGSVDLLERKGDGETIERIKASILRIDHTVGELLELAKVESSGSERRCSLPFSAIVANCVEASDNEGVFQDVTVKQDLADAHIHGDANAIGRMVRELLSNAASQATSEIMVRLTVKGDHAVLVVADDGPGFAASDLSRVFDRFFTRRVGGTGLGLAMARAVVDAHGGEISAANGAERGAEVTVDLPIV